MPTRLDLPDGGFLRGLFPHNQLLYVDNRLMWQSWLPWGARIAQDYSITFDTQVVRYLALAIQGSANPMAMKVKSALSTLSRAGWNWDFFAYIEENADRLNRAEVYASRKFHDNVRAVEIVKDLDERHFLATGQLRARSNDREIAQRVEATLTYVERRPEPLRQFYRQNQRVMYAVLLAIIQIQLRAPPDEGKTPRPAYLFPRRPAYPETVLAERAQPAMIVTDNGPEFISKALDQWAHERGIVQHFNLPGKPVENAYIESFNGRVRDECLNLHWFQTLPQARLIVAA